MIVLENITVLMVLWQILVVINKPNVWYWCYKIKCLPGLHIAKACTVSICQHLGCMHVYINCRKHTCSETL